ncbi:MAG: cytochrome c, partial [Gammaproteobacteria bacterium]|nr:cytochrome c [Gammaproteobacteria bacterium]
MYVRVFVSVLVVAVCGACSPEVESPTPELEESETLESTDQFQVGLGELGDRDALPGAALYASNCATCHDGTVQKAPHFSWLEMMPGRTLMAAMSDGIMASQASHLKETERVHIVEYL